jgi:hypothetical protein
MAQAGQKSERHGAYTEMVIIVTIPMHVSNPFSNGAKEIKETYMRIYQFDYKKANCYPSDFEYVALD